MALPSTTAGGGPPGRFGRRGRRPTVGKRVVYVTPYANAAKEEAEKHVRMGQTVEIKRERDDQGAIVYIVYVM